MSPLNGSGRTEAPSVDELIAKGKRDLLCSDISSAVECFATACEILSGKLGDLHDDLAMPNLLYGTALLELARTENTVLSESLELLQSDHSSSDEEEDNKLQPDSQNGAVENAGKENSESTTDHDADGTTGQGVLAVAGTQVDGVDGMKKFEEGKGKIDCQPSGSKSDAEEEDDRDGGEISSLQLAWEVVEVARSIYSRHNDVEHKLKCADCLEKLGEIGQEIGNYEVAAKDLLECLNIRMENDPKNYRLIAVSHFQLAVAYANINDQRSAHSSFGEALSSLEKCRTVLKCQLNTLEKEGGSDGGSVRELELKILEVAGLINEIAERRKEVDNCSVVPAQPRQEALKADVPVDDVSHLIKKKRPVCNLEEVEPAKKARIEKGEEEEEKDLAPDTLPKMSDS